MFSNIFKFRDLEIIYFILLIFLFFVCFVLIIDYLLLLTPVNNNSEVPRQVIKIFAKPPFIFTLNIIIIFVELDFIIVIDMILKPILKNF
jgi:hypothetical protein